VNKEKTMRKLIVILSVLLGISVIVLGIVWAYRFFANDEPYQVTIPDNYINKGSGETESEEDILTEDDLIEDTLPPVKDPAAGNTVIPNYGAPMAAAPTAETKASALILHNKNEGDNIPFDVGNMFPGDAETGYYCVKVYYHSEVTVRFRAEVRHGYEKLAEVMNCRVTLLNTDAVLYEGLMRDMPESVNHVLYSEESTSTELYYQIVAYLDTSVGNEYQNKDLIADFRWWVEETENLDPPAQTGDAVDYLQYGALTLGSVVALLLLILKRKRGRI